MAVTTVYGVSGTQFHAPGRLFIRGSVLVSDADAMTYESVKEAASQWLFEVDAVMTEEELRETPEGAAALADFRPGDNEILEAEAQEQHSHYVRDTLAS